MRRTIYILWIIIILQSLSSCRSTLHPNEMFRLKSKDILSSNTELLNSNHYYLVAGDEISVKVFSNDGEKLLDPLAVKGQAIADGQASYIIDDDGTVNLPILGRVKLIGYSLREADSVLVIEYEKTIIEPFVQVKVLNKRAFVFPGGGESQAMVIPLENPQTTLIEALALVGGINNGKSNKIKLIRNDGQSVKIYLLDLSQYDQIMYSSIVLQANDLIYVDPRSRVGKKILEEITPYLALISTIAIIYNITSN